MAVLKCKMCGGDLEIQGGITVAECEYCGTNQTVADSNDEKLRGLYNRANILRIKSEFDKAEQLYEKILQSDETQAEAYWGLILCKYGIEYVEDPQSFKRVPTCHRTSFDSIVADDDYKSALKYADVSQRAIYEAEAAEIDRIQKEIIALSSKESPYDVFICYKETDENGKRTQDSVIANDIYYQLTQEGFKVFYAAITLEDKLGSAYEPCIFAALNSARVMLAIGTKPEHFNAVWVKNEWSRYLKIMKKDRNKVLIPCFKDMDAYELPEEFAHLQALDMSKIGFINDVVRGIKKLIGTNDEPIVKESVTQNEYANGNITALLKRGYFALEDSEWERADEFFEQALNYDAEQPEAYLGKMMAQLHVQKRDELIKCVNPFDNNTNYKKVMRFGDDELKNFLSNCTQTINYRHEIKQKEDAYKSAVAAMEDLKYNDDEDLAFTESNYCYVATRFDALKGYKDSEELASKCRKEAVVARQRYEEKVKADEERENIRYRKKKKMFLVAVSVACVILLIIAAISNINLRPWKNIAQVSCGGYHTVGLKENGKVVAIGLNEDGQCDVGKWRNITAISAGGYHTVGLKEDGTVVATGLNDDDQCDVDGWKDIIAISAGVYHTVGLKENGEVVATGHNSHGQCNIENWENIIAISVSTYNTYGIKKDGTVVATGSRALGECKVNEWKDIVAISAGGDHVVGLKKDGTVVATGGGAYGGVLGVDEWKDIIAISTSAYNTYGIKKDGSVVATGGNNQDQCDVDDWEDITAISAGFCHTVGLKENGKVVTVGGNASGQCNTGFWKRKKD